MSQEAFEKWWQESRWREMTLTGVGLKCVALDALQLLQPEIDAKDMKISALEASHAILADANALLRAEVISRENIISGYSREAEQFKATISNQQDELFKFRAEVERLRADADLNRARYLREVYRSR